MNDKFKLFSIIAVCCCICLPLLFCSEASAQYTQYQCANGQCTPVAMSYYTLPASATASPVSAATCPCDGCQCTLSTPLSEVATRPTIRYRTRHVIRGSSGSGRCGIGVFQNRPIRRAVGGVFRFGCCR